MKGNEGCIVEFTVLRTGKTTGPPADNMLFLFNEPSLAHQ